MLAGTAKGAICFLAKKSQASVMHVQERAHRGILHQMQHLPRSEGGDAIVSAGYDRTVKLWRVLCDRNAPAYRVDLECLSI